MKKILENFYVFSKLIFSFTLLICLFTLLYIFYINYQKEKNISKNDISIYEDLKNIINNNSSTIKNISEKINTTQSDLTEIKNNIDYLSSQNNINDYSEVNKNIELLNNSLQLMSNEIENLKQQNNLKLKNNEDYEPNIINTGKEEIIDLILIKYENNIEFSDEIQFLKNIPESNSASIEKISVLMLDRFKGYSYLKNIFDKEVSIYLKKTLNKNPDSLFNKIILPYIDISPTSENIPNDDLIIKIKQIKLNIENKNIEKALSNMQTINQYQNIFQLSSFEINKYLKFKTELLQLK